MQLRFLLTGLVVMSVSAFKSLMRLDIIRVQSSFKTSILYNRNDHLIPVTSYRNVKKSSTIQMNRCDKYATDVLSKPRWGGAIIGPIVRYFNTVWIGLLFSFILRVMNNFKTYRQNILFHHIFKRPKNKGLLTVSNHQSVADDPGLFAAFIPWWRISPRRLRWVLCTEDVFFAVS